MFTGSSKNVTPIVVYLRVQYRINPEVNLVFYDKMDREPMPRTEKTGTREKVAWALMTFQLCNAPGDDNIFPGPLIIITIHFFQQNVEKAQMNSIAV